MLKSVLKSKRVTPFFPLIYNLEVAQYFTECERHYLKMVRFHGLNERVAPETVHFFDYKNKTVFENMTFDKRYFKNNFSKPTEIQFINCTFSGCDFFTDTHLKFVFDRCRFDMVKNGSISNVHNRFNGNQGSYVIRRTEHAMILCTLPVSGETTFDMTLEECHEVSIYISGYTRIQLRIKNCDIRRILLKDANCLVYHTDSHLHSFLYLPPTQLDLKDKCSHLYQTTNSVINGDFMSKNNPDYFPINLLRQLAKRHKYAEELADYQKQIKAGVPSEVIQEPIKDITLYIMQLFDYFTYPLSLFYRILKVIVFYAIIYLLVGVVHLPTGSVFSIFNLVNLQAGLPEVLGTISKALYFSIVSITTVGYGDYVLRSGFELIAASEALIGVIYTGSLIISIFNRFHN